MDVFSFKRAVFPHFRVTSYMAHFAVVSVNFELKRIEYYDSLKKNRGALSTIHAVSIRTYWYSRD